MLRHYTVLKGRLMPYLWAQANKTHQVGVPMMRSMVIAFTDDTACKYLDQEYMLGDNLCIVPVRMRKEKLSSMYLIVVPGQISSPVRSMRVADITQDSVITSRLRSWLVQTALLLR